MKKLDIEKIIENKYSLLLFSLILLIVLSPIVDSYRLIAFFAESFLFMAIIVIMLRILDAGKTLFVISVSFAFFGILFHYLATFIVQNKHIGLLALFTYMLYIAIAIIFMLKKIFSEKRVTGDTIKGSISIYIFIGIWWQIFYTAIWVINPASFILQINRIDSPDFFYFSFTTMTTLGYGDVIPKSYTAKTAAVLQAITGQMYLAVLVARLVGLHTAHHDKKD
ncbi:MAG: potassium channel family protein [Proteobacteria bacterium]|nr:potassium channel family protein [Pseudomonadota bacterium]